MKPRALRVLALVGAVLVTVVTAPVHAQTPSSDQKAEFNKLLQQRNRLTVQLYRLDDRASELIKQGDDPVVVHAEQVSVQDQIDLAELRLAIIATRYGLDVPPPPDPAASEVTGGNGEPADPRIDRAFARGRNRAIERIRADGLQLLAVIDFSKFLAE